MADELKENPMSTMEGLFDKIASSGAAVGELVSVTDTLSKTLGSVTNSLSTFSNALNNSLSAIGKLGKTESPDIAEPRGPRSLYHLSRSDELELAKKMADN